MLTGGVVAGPFHARKDVSGVDFGPGGRQLLAGGADGVHLWDVMGAESRQALVLADVAEAVAGRRTTEHGAIEFVVHRPVREF